MIINNDFGNKLGLHHISQYIIVNYKEANKLIGCISPFHNYSARI